MKQLVLLRHSVRIDKGDGPPLDPSSWLLNYDPPLNLQEAVNQVAQLHVAFAQDTEIIIHSSPYNRCIQTLELLLDKLPQKDPKLRIDQSLSEWLNFNFNSNFLPPNDNGISLLNNINQYLYQQGSKLHRDMNWDSYKFGQPGEYGEEYEVFKKRCLQFMNKLLKYYQDSNKIVIVVSHGAVISVLLQIILQKPLFKEIPLCDPVVLNKLNQNLFQFHSEIDFLNKFEQRIYKLKDLNLPVEYETNMFIDNNGESEHGTDEEGEEEDDDDSNDEEGIVFQVRSRSNTTGSIHPKLKRSPMMMPSSSEKNFHDLKKSFFDAEPEVELKKEELSSEEDELLLNFGSTLQAARGSKTRPTQTYYSDDKKSLKKLLLLSNNNLYNINEEEDYWFGFNR